MENGTGPAGPAVYNLQNKRPFFPEKRTFPPIRGGRTFEPGNCCGRPPDGRYTDEKNACFFSEMF